MKIQKVFQTFSELIHSRLKNGVYTTEDSIRYTFFAALLRETELRPEDVVLEERHPHPEKTGAEIDTWILSAEDRCGFALEFKYDRKIPSKKNAPKTQKAGKVFHDLYRLSLLPTDVKRFFVYVADPEMVAYFRKCSNGFAKFFDLGVEASMHIDSAYFQNRSKTLKNSLGTLPVGTFPSIDVVTRYSEILPDEHQLRIFEVLSV
jgi:hypothetical protein